MQVPSFSNIVVLLFWDVLGERYTGLYTGSDEKWVCADKQADTSSM